MTFTTIESNLNHPIRKKTEGEIYSKPSIISNTPEKSNKKEKNFFITFEKSNTEKLKKEIKRYEASNIDIDSNEESVIAPVTNRGINDEFNFNENNNNKLDFMKYNLKRNENAVKEHFLLPSSSNNTPSNKIYKKIQLGTKTNFEKGKYNLTLFLFTIRY